MLTYANRNSKCKSVDLGGQLITHRNQHNAQSLALRHWMGMKKNLQSAADHFSLHFLSCAGHFQLYPLTGEGDGWVGNGLWTCRQPENKGVGWCKEKPPNPSSFSFSHLHITVGTNRQRTAGGMVGLFVDSGRSSPANCGHDAQIAKIALRPRQKFSDT